MRTEFRLYEMLDEAHMKKTVSLALLSPIILLGSNDTLAEKQPSAADGICK